jgi:anti-sigma regulatory factor (Ser/Thr protein kinase)
MTTPSAHHGFHHEAFFYADRDEFLAGAVPFVEEGLAAGEAILVAVPEPRRRLLQSAFDPRAGEVRFLAMEEIGRNPGRIISAWRDFLTAGGERGGAVRGIGEPVWAGRSAEEIDECQRHEQLLNLAFDGGPAWSLMCPYDASALGDEVLAAAARSHPHCSGSHRGAGGHAAPADLGSLLAGPLPEPDGPAAAMCFGKADLREVRRLVSERARTAGLDVRRGEDLVLAVCELATNSVQHGGGEGSLRVWDVDGGLCCEVRDSGRIDDPLVGRERPPLEQVGGRGVWIAHQLCDLVRLRSDEQGTRVRVQMAIAGGMSDEEEPEETLHEGASAQQRH